MSLSKLLPPNIIVVVFLLATGIVPNLELIFNQPDNFRSIALWFLLGNLIWMLRPFFNTHKEN